MVENYQSQFGDSTNHTLIALLVTLKKKIEYFFLKITRTILKRRYLFFGGLLLIESCGDDPGTWDPWAPSKSGHG